MIRLLNKDLFYNKEDNILKTAIMNNSTFVILNFLRFIVTYQQANHFKLPELFQLSLNQPIKNEQIGLCLLEKIVSLYPSDSIEKNELLISAIQTNSLNITRRLLLYGANPNYIDGTNTSFLYYVLETENSDLLQLLIDHYDINVNQIYREENIIFHAISKNNSKLSSILIEGGTNINCKNVKNEFLIEAYINKGWFIHIKHILEKGFKQLYNDDLLFLRMCRSALNTKSTIIFHLIITNYFATKIARWWRKIKRKL